MPALCRNRAAGIDSIIVYGLLCIASRRQGESGGLASGGPPLSDMAVWRRENRVFELIYSCMSLIPPAEGALYYVRAGKAVRP